MSKTRVEFHAGNLGEALNSPELAAFLKSKAEVVATSARASAPVDTGEYRDSITVEVAHTDRVVGRVHAKAPHSWVVEANTGNLQRALGSA